MHVTVDDFESIFRHDRFPRFLISFRPVVADGLILR
jgi:hypothetical protein